MRIGRSPRLGRFVMLRDAYGNTYTYAHLGKLAAQRARRQGAGAAREAGRRAGARRAARRSRPGRRRPAPAPTAAAAQAARGRRAGGRAASRAAARRPGRRRPPPPPPPPSRSASSPTPARSRSLASGGRRQILDATFALPASASLRSYFAGDVGLERDELELKRMFAGRRVIAGTILGRVGSTSTSSTGTQPHVRFSIRPPGKGVPRIDPEPFIEGWRLLESTNIFRARGAGALAGGSVGQILLMSKDTLAKRVLANPDIDIYECGRRDIAAGIVDRRVLATLEFLAANGLRPTVSSIRCGHRFFTETGNVSQHSSGNGVDIAKINGQAILGSQGPGSITDLTVRRLLTLQGTMAPAQIISLMSYPARRRRWRWPTTPTTSTSASARSAARAAAASTRSAFSPSSGCGSSTASGGSPTRSSAGFAGRSAGDGGLAHLAARHEVVPDVEQRHLKPAAAGRAELGELGAVPVGVPAAVVVEVDRRAGTCSGRRASGRPRSASRRTSSRAAR